MYKLFVTISAFILVVSQQLFAQQNTLKAYKDTTVTNYFKREKGMVAGDGGYSLQLSDGRIFWTFGDSFIDTYNPQTRSIPCLFQVNNSALLQPYNNWDWHQSQTLIDENDTGGFGRSLMKSPNKGEFYWPVGAVQLKDTVYVFSSGIKLGGPIGFDYSGRNVLTKLKFPEMKVTGYINLHDFGGVHYGTGFITEGRYTYVYGIKTVEKNNDLYLARFSSANPEGAWTCWDGKGWNADMKKAAVVKKNAGQTPFVHKVKNKLVLISSEYSVGCDMGKDIYTATSNKFTGPFTALKTIYTIDDTLNGHYPFFYVPVIHPFYINKRNEVLVTYCINGYGTCAEGCPGGKMDPNRYRLRGIRVPLKLIDANL